jgi:uncharacterized protein YjbJ (UPF0337 family)
MPCPLYLLWGHNGCRFWGGGEGGASSGDFKMADDLTRDGMKNQGEGLLDEAKGRVRNTVGGITGDTSEQLKGKGEELKGKAQRKIGEKQVDADNDV